MFGNSDDNAGYTLPVDKWVVFKAVLNLNEGKKIVKASYYIDGIEQHQAGQNRRSHTPARISSPKKMLLRVWAK